MDLMMFMDILWKMIIASHQVMVRRIEKCIMSVVRMGWTCYMRWLKWRAN